MHKFQDFLAENRQLDEAAFVAKYPHPFLVSDGSGASGASGTGAPPEAATKKLPKPEPGAPAPEGGSDTLWVIPVKRREGSKLSIITVGRGEDCDIRLSHALVSKKHAYLQQEGEGWTITDVASTNCTFADGSKLEAHKAYPLSGSEAIRFGPAVKYRFFLSRGFFEYMQFRARMKDTKGFKPSAVAPPPAPPKKSLKESDSDALDRALRAFEK